MNNRLVDVLCERKAPDDLVAAVFEERDLIVVLRLRIDNGRKVLIVNDGAGEPIAAPLHTVRDLSRILPPHGEPEQVGYEFARAVIARALGD